MAIDWVQVGEDFSQKYSGSYCRYLSPFSKKWEVFQILEVGVNNNKPPDLALFSDKHGEIHLNYNTEADLDFTFPQIGNFQKKDRCLRFEKRHERQWRKGVCHGTAKIYFPYTILYPAFHYGIDEDTLNFAYQGFTPTTMTDAVKRMRAEEAFSIALSPTLSLGHGDPENTYWLWFEDEVIGELKDGKLTLHNVIYQQEVTDFIRDMRDDVRIT